MPTEYIFVLLIAVVLAYAVGLKRSKVEYIEVDAEQESIDEYAVFLSGFETGYAAANQGYAYMPKRKHVLLGRNVHGYFACALKANHSGVVPVFPKPTTNGYTPEPSYEGPPPRDYDEYEYTGQ